MSIEPIAAIEAITDMAKAQSTEQSAQSTFPSWITEQVQGADTKIKTAEHQVQQLALGEADNLHQVMISLAKAKTSFELTVQVRNKLLEGFKEVMRMSI